MDVNWKLVSLDGNLTVRSVIIKCAGEASWRRTHLSSLIKSFSEIKCQRRNGLETEVPVRVCRSLTVWGRFCVLCRRL